MLCLDVLATSSRNNTNMTRVMVMKLQRVGFYMIGAACGILRAQ